MTSSRSPNQVVAVLAALALLALAMWVSRSSSGEPTATISPTEGLDSSPSVLGDRVIPSGSSRGSEDVATNGARIATLDERRGTWTLNVLEEGSLSPLSEAVASLRDTVAASTRPWAEATTKADGSCELPCWGDTQTRLRVSVTGWASRSIDFPSPPPGSNLVVRLTREQVVRVLVVRQEDGVPIVGADVVIAIASANIETSRSAWRAYSIPAPVDRHSDWSAQTDASGIATITGCALDLFDLHVFAVGRATHVARSAEVPATDAVMRIELGLGHSVKTRIVEEGGRPLVGWDVHFLADNTCWRTESDENGESESPGLPSGTRLTVSTRREDLDPTAALWQQLVAPLKKELILPAETVVELVVPKSAPTQIDLRWPPGDDGDTLEVEVLQRLGNGTLATVQVSSVRSSKGAAALTVPGPGVYLVEAVGSRSGTWRTGFIDASSQKIPLAYLEALQPRSGILFGRVSSPGGTPMSGAVLTLRVLNEGVGLQSPLRRAIASLLPGPGTAQTDASGEFAWTQLLPGVYTLEVRAADGAAWADSVRVSEDSRVEVILRATGTIEGTSVCAAGSDLLWAEVRHVDLDLHYRTPVDSAGHFRLRDLVPGTYELHIRTFDPMAALLGARPEPIRVSVRANEVTHCSIRTAARVSKLTLRVLGAYTISDQMDVQVERFHPHDRVGSSVWKVRRPIPPTRRLQLAEGPPPGRYGVSILDRQSNALRGFTVVEVNHGSDGSCDVVVEPLVQVSIASRIPTADLRITPLDVDGTMARDTTLPVVSGSGPTDLRANLPPGRYALVAAGSTRHIGSISKRVDFVVGSEPVTVVWQ